MTNAQSDAALTDPRRDVMEQRISERNVGKLLKLPSMDNTDLFDRLQEEHDLRGRAAAIAALSDALQRVRAETREEDAKEAIKHAETLEKIADSLVDKPHYVAADFDADFDCREIATWLRVRARKDCP